MTGPALVEAIRTIIGDRRAATTRDLLAALAEKGTELDPRSLAGALRPYGVRPRTVRLPGASATPKGYGATASTPASRALGPLTTSATWPSSSATTAHSPTRCRRNPAAAPAPSPTTTAAFAAGGPSRGCRDERRYGSDPTPGAHP